MAINRGQLLWPSIAAAVLALTMLLHASGGLARLENALGDKRAALLAHERESNIVIVGIDPQSLGALREWPWPRRHHARLLQQLARAQPRSVFIDIDFSSPSGDDDVLLERELAAWRGAPVMLAAHFQPLRGGSGPLTVTRPLPQLAQHSQLVSVVLEPSADGLVRAMRPTWQVDGETLHSVFAVNTPLPDRTVVPIDFSIASSSFEYVSFIDVLNGSAENALRGKDVYVGPTAWELGDILQVPVYRALPGVVVQALATESVRAGVLRPLAAPLNGALLALWTALAAALFARWSWRRNLLAVAAGLALLGAAAVTLYAEQRIVFEAVPFAVALAAIFIAAALRSLDRQTLRALSYALGLKRRDALLKSIVESTADCIVCVDEHTGIRTANPAAARLFGTPAVIGARLKDLVPELLAGERSVEGLCGAVFERVALTHQGGKVPVEISVSRVATENGKLYTAIIRDVSERAQQQRALEHQATHDPLTGLPNRTALNARLAALFPEGRPPPRPVALLMLDLSRFKEVNDTLGHDVGDEVLREVARRFASQLPEAAFIARIGGDEFTIVLTEVAGRDAIEKLSAGVAESLRAPIDARGIAIEVGVNVGIAMAPNDARDPKELLRHADVAMYVAKRQGTVREFYEREQDQHTVRRLSMLGELRAAIENSGISLHYQPQVSLRTGRLEGVEALVRWNHAMHGSVGPAEFVTLAESSNLIGPLTDWTLTQALTDIAAWKRRGLDLRVAINVSARVLQDVDFPARIKELLAQHAVKPQQLELEITESAMMVDPDRARHVIQALHGLGALISIDDYGTGYSSLGYLRDLRVHALKLDRSFVIDLETRQQNRVIVESTVQMAHALGLQVVAEGVETQWERDYLAAAGYDLGQGYWFARPMPGDALADWAAEFGRASLARTG